MADFDIKLSYFPYNQYTFQSYNQYFTYNQYSRTVLSLFLAYKLFIQNK